MKSFSRRSRWRRGVLWCGLWLLLAGCGRATPAPTQAGCDDCMAPSVCVDDVCQAPSCVPDARFCQAGSVWKCDHAGALGRLVTTCGAQEYCAEHDRDADCLQGACVPGARVCDGARATTCEPDGSRPAPGGDDCAAAGQSCYRGQCRAQACVARQRLCQDGDVYVCAENGTAVALLADCSEDETCNAESGTCQPRQCAAGTVSCDADRVVSCRDDGSGWDQSGPDCAASGRRCLAGSCGPTCAPGATFCKGNAVVQCDETGTTSTLLSDCDALPSGYLCQATPNGYARCAAEQCYAGRRFCDGNIAKRCNDDGSIPSLGEDCGTTGQCDEGRCFPILCQAYALGCEAGDIYVCLTNASGGDGQMFFEQSCPSTSPCGSFEGQVTCVSPVCQPNAVSCVDNRVGPCAADGAALASLSLDCAADGEACDAAGSCAASVVETLGAAEDVGHEPSEFAATGNVLEVHSTRRLTKLELDLTVTEPRKVRVIIFEQSGGEWRGLVDRAGSVSVTDGFVSTGPLDATLVAGKRYLLGFVGLGGLGGSSQVKVDLAPFEPSLSFAYAHGTASASAPANLLSFSEIYRMRLTTELP